MGYQAFHIRFASPSLALDWFILSWLHLEPCVTIFNVMEFYKYVDEGM